MALSSSKFKAMIQVVEILSHSPIVQQYVGDKIYPLINTDETDGDFIAYQRAGYRRQDTKMGIAVQGTEFYITVVSDNYNRSLDIAEAVYQALEGDHRDGGLRIRMTDNEEDYLDKKFCQIIKFTLE